MAVTNYNYTISTDFPNEVVSANRLVLEVQDSAIVTALDSISVAGDTCTVAFKAALSSGDETILDGLINVHSGEALPKIVDPVILEPTGDSEKSLLIHGRKFTATLDTDTTYDISFSEDRSIQGIITEVVNMHVDDHMRIAIVHPVTKDELRVLAEGVSSGGVPIPASGMLNVVSEGTAELTAGVEIRATYHSAATTGDAPIIRVTFRTWV
jgi:hypothetical protein